MSKIKVLRVNAAAKINLHLEVLGLRGDGFHELAMVMQSINLFDQLELKARNDSEIKLDTDKEGLATNEENLIIKAAQKLIKKSGRSSTLGADIYLKKRIPIGAGLAGGSSDGAATLIGLNILWDLGFSIHELENFAGELGSDMPFCLKGGTQLCFGRGEKLEPQRIQNSSIGVLLVKDPLISISTPWAYKRYREINETKYLKSEHEFELKRDCLRNEKYIRNLGGNSIFKIRNDLQQVVAPEIDAVKKSLKFLRSLPNTLAVSMSGSGPSCFALYSDFNKANQALNNHKEAIANAGLQSWSCSFTANGISWEK